MASMRFSQMNPVNINMLKLTLADISEPNVLESALALAVDTLELVLSNDDVAQSSTIIQDEHSVVAAGIVIVVALTATVELLVAVVLRTGDLDGSIVGLDGSDSGRDVQGLRGGSGGQGQSSEDLLVEHFERCKDVELSEFVEEWMLMVW